MRLNSLYIYWRASCKRFALLQLVTLLFSYTFVNCITHKSSCADSNSCNRICNEKSQDSRNHLLTKNSNARSEIDHSILIWKKFDLERRFQAKNCFEKAALSNGNLMTARDKALIINLITLVDEMLGNLGGNHGDQILLSTQKFFCFKNTHSNNFLVCFLSLTAAT